MKKGIIQLLYANILYLILNVLNSFLLPKFLSIETYAVIKTYTLYIGYAGFLSLGFADGMYLRYGGENIDAIGVKELGSNFKSYLILEIIVNIICLLIGILFNDFVFLAFALGSLFINLIGYYKNLYQAAGEYKLYGKSLNYQTIILFMLNLLLMLGFKSDNSVWYIVLQVGSAFITMLYLTMVLNKRTSFLSGGKPSFRQIYENVTSGFVLMLGNFSSSLFTSLDRWFVKFLMNITFFAQYSFAVSLENIVSVFVSPITISLYNEFCINRSPKYVKKIKHMLLIWGCFIISAAYPIKFIITFFLPEYQASIEILFPLIGAQAFYTIIKGIHVNMYKAEKKQQRYFFVLCCMLIVAFITNIVFYFIFKTVWSFAIATFVTAAIWFFFCELEEKALRLDYAAYITLFGVLSGYFVASMIDNALFGLCIYYLCLFSFSYIFMKETINDIWNIGVRLLKTRRG